MVNQLQEEQNKLYDRDYSLWLLETVEKLKQRDLDSLDYPNLIDEILDLSKREKRKIESLLIKLFEHLLLLKYWQLEKERNRGHWEREITSFRLQIIRQLEDSPSLKTHLENKLRPCYQDGCKLASKHSQLPKNTFPNEPIASLDQILDENWLP